MNSHSHAPANMNMRPYNAKEFFSQKDIKLLHMICCDRTKMRRVIRMAKKHYREWVG